MIFYEEKEGLFTQQKHPGPTLSLVAFAFQTLSSSK
jgi:hypothetical protein